MEVDDANRARNVFHRFPLSRCDKCCSILIEAHLVPLSAYNIIQQATYRPNDTLPALPLSNLIPSVLRNSAGDLTPQILTVGDVLVLNGSTFNYTIIEAFDDPSMTTPVSSFSYYNNPLSDGCDVTNMTFGLVAEASTWQVHFSGTVTCHIPTGFYLGWSVYGNIDSLSDELRTLPLYLVDQLICSGSGNSSTYENILSDRKVRIMAWATNPPVVFREDRNTNSTRLTISFTVHPCCNCDTALEGSSLETTSLLQPPCSLNPVGFIVIDIPGDPFDNGWTDSSGYFYPAGLLNTPANISDVFKYAMEIQENVAENFSAGCQNIFQALYHLVRLDLGVILENQIYNSPEIYNHTIQSYDLRADMYGDYNHPSIWGDPGLRGLTSNATFMAAWQKQVDFFKTSDRVPVLQYLRSTPRIKPLGSAITSVFVSTFAMLSALWTIFSIVAGALAGIHNVNTRQDEHMPSPELQCMLNKLEHSTGRTTTKVIDSNLALRTSHGGSSCLEKMAMKNMTMDMAFAHHAAHMERSLARINFVLKKYGLTHEDPEESENKIETVMSRGNVILSKRVSRSNKL
ncbi:hypothetical protein GGX14DRAFT_635518 [Mycena pura]|uniref:Uncharacterized protein n=1 Tax=Mycena pura TaxID=153505 RepID=A0AAD6VBN5_9AGAR|nr:hypothetical protein GGX14DRAFT_635518 [Mycena pura]